MIAAAFGLLVVALVLLLVGVAKSSVAPLVLSLLSTAGAGALLIASWSHYRRALTAAGEGAGDHTGTFIAPLGNGHGPSGSAPANWDSLADDDAAALAGTYGFDELQALRAYEVAHGYRRTVLDAMDARLEEIVVTRRQVG